MSEMTNVEAAAALDGGSMTADLPALRALVYRLEAATGPDRELDEALWAVFQNDEGRSSSEAPRLTSSLDAAIGLVERHGYGWQIDQDEGCFLSNEDDSFDVAKGATPPLSVCLAFCRAEMMRVRGAAERAAAAQGP